MKRLLLITLLAIQVFAQPQPSAPPQFRGRGNTLPPTCTANRDLFWKSNAPAGQNVYGCTATNTWTLEAGGGAAGLSGLTAAKIPKATSSTAVGDSSLSDDGTTVSTSEAVSLTGSFTTAGLNWFHRTLTAGQNNTLFGPAISTYDAGIQGEFQLAENALGSIDDVLNHPNTVKMIKQCSTASASCAASSARGYVVGANNLNYMGGGECETTHHGTGVVTLLSGCGGHIIMDGTGGTATIATAFWAASANISNTTQPFLADFYSAPPTLGTGGAVTTYSPITISGRTGGSDVNIWTNLGLFLLTSPRGSAGTNDSPAQTLRAPTFDTGAHAADWQWLVHPTSNAGASTYRLQSRIDAASFADKFTVDDTGHGSLAGGLSTGASAPTCTPGTGGPVCLHEGTAVTAESGADNCYGDSTAHGILCSYNGGPLLPLPLVPTFSALTDGATVTWAVASAPLGNASLTFTAHGGSRTLNLTGLVNGGSYVLWLKQDGTGGEGLTLGTGCAWKVSGGGSGAITPSTGANAIDVLAFTYDGTNCYANFAKNFN